MMIGHGNEYVAITEQERVPDTLPTPGDVRVAVTVGLEEFTGHYTGVWLAKPDLERFVQAFEAMLSAHAGQARLEAMSPGEFMFQLEPSGSRGHFLVHVRLVRLAYIGDRPSARSIEGEFEIELSRLVSALSGFKAMLN